MYKRKIGYFNLKAHYNGCIINSDLLGGEPVMRWYVSQKLDLPGSINFKQCRYYTIPFHTIDRVLFLLNLRIPNFQDEI